MYRDQRDLREQWSMVSRAGDLTTRHDTTRMKKGESQAEIALDWNVQSASTAVTL